MMLPQSGAPRIAGMNRGPSGLVRRPGLLPGAAPAPTPTPAPAAGAPTVQPEGMVPTNGPMVNAVAPTPPAIQPVGGPMLNAQTPPAPTLKGVSVSGIDPNNDLRNSTIAPTNDVNRFDLVNERLKNYDATALPEFQAATRKITSNAAGQGRLGSGMYNTDLGNETLAAENARNSYFGNLLTDATQGTITDAANNRNELRGERGYQTGAEQSAYDRSRQGVFDTDTLTNSAAGRAATQAQLGFGNDPSSLIAMLSQMSGQQAASGAAGVGSSGANQQYLDLLKQILGQGASGTTAPAPATGINGGAIDKTLQDMLKRSTMKGGYQPQVTGGG